MERKIEFGSSAIHEMYEGVRTLTSAVASTMGPSGKNVLIREPYKEPHITKDGVTVAKSVKLSNPIMESGAQIIRQAASKTCDDTGDGTTSVTVLANELINNGLNIIDVFKNAKLNSMRDGMIYISNEISEYIKNKLSIPCDNEELIKHVATISGNNDKNIGDIVCEAMMKATKDGAVSIESSPVRETYVDTIIGIRFDKGFKSPMFANSEDGQSCEYNSCNILLWKGTIDDMNEFIPVLSKSVELNRPLLIIADGYSYDILNSLAYNKQKGFSIIAVEAPSFRKQRENMMRDIAIMTGGDIVNEFGVTPQNFTADNLGSCEKISSTKNYTTIIGGDGDNDEIQQRIKEIKDALEFENDKIERSWLKERLSKLAGGVSIIYVGGDSEIEVNETKDRIDDSVCAVRSAMEMGIVAGGGSTYVRCKEFCDNLIDKYKEKHKDNDFENDWFLTGMQLVKSSLDSCIRKILENCYMSNDEILSVIHTIENNSDNNKFGYNALLMKFENDMIKSGIVDPTKTSIMVLLNAVSTAAMFLTTNCYIIEGDGEIRY